MLREFIKCNSLAERITIIENSVPADWDQAELSTVSRIVGVSEYVKGMSPAETLKTIKTELNKKLAEDLKDNSAAKEITRLSETEEKGRNEKNEERLPYIEYLGNAMVASRLMNPTYPQ